MLQISWLDLTASWRDSVRIDVAYGAVRVVKGAQALPNVQTSWQGCVDC
jgi:hypothetical protein